MYSCEHPFKNNQWVNELGVGLKTSLHNLPNQSVLAALDCQYAEWCIPHLAVRCIRYRAVRCIYFEKATSICSTSLKLAPPLPRSLPREGGGKQSKASAARELKQSKAKQSKAKQSKAKQSKAKQSKAKQSKAKHLSLDGGVATVQGQREIGERVLVK
jgi:hypothetical protein